jgi:hypothetical protein
MLHSYYLATAASVGFRILAISSHVTILRAEVYFGSSVIGKRKMLDFFAI